MKSLFILLFFLATNLAIFAQTPDCKPLHTGTFKLVDEKSGTTYIKRTDKLQIEKNDILGYEVIFDIKWIDDCTYELRPKEVIKGDPAIMGNGNHVLTTTIKEISGKKYITQSSANFFHGVYVFVIEIAN
jgi:hypothetical protein